MVKRVAKFAGVPNWKEITPHKLRHTTAIIGALAAREGRVDPETIRRQLRWRNINMLSTYADMSEALFREGYDRAYEVGYGGGEEEDTM
jgi:integrase